MKAFTTTSLTLVSPMNRKYLKFKQQLRTPVIYTQVPGPVFDDLLYSVFTTEALCGVGERYQLGSEQLGECHWMNNWRERKRKSEQEEDRKREGGWRKGEKKGWPSCALDIEILCLVRLRSHYQTACNVRQIPKWKFYNKLLFGLEVYYAHSFNKLLLIHIDNQSLSEGE